VTISDAEAVSWSTSTTTGMEVWIAPPAAVSMTVGWVRPRVVTIVPEGMKMDATRRASLTRPPPSARKSNTRPRTPCLSSPWTAS
jgi:hypothetical protein